MFHKRRSFIRDTSVIAVSLPLTGLINADFFQTPPRKFPIYFFSKPLDEFEMEFMSECLAMAGIDGFDLTVRPKGKVEPGQISDDLPKIIDIGKKYKLATEMMVTAITDPDAKDTEEILKTASSLGIRHYRMGYYDFDLKEGIQPSLLKIKKKLEKLAKLNKQYNIQAGYQNHTGIKVGSAVWDLYQLIQDLPVSAISSQFDIRHAVTEGSNSWLLSLHLLSKNIGSLAVKDFTWSVANGKATVVNVPLGEGIVDFEKYFQTIKALNIVAPISLHIEYPFFSGQEGSLSLPDKQKIIVRKLKKDTDFIRSHLTKFQLV